jgi:hypothetical protein
VVFAPFHYGYWDVGTEPGPDGHEPRAANELTLTRWDPVSKQPMFKVASVKVTRVAAGDGSRSPAPTNTASSPIVVVDGPPTAGGPAAEAAESVSTGSAGT